MHPRREGEGQDRAVFTYPGRRGCEGAGCWCLVHSTGLRKAGQCELQHFGFGLQHGLTETVCLIHSKISRKAQTSPGTHLPHLFQNNELCLCTVLAKLLVPLKHNWKGNQYLRNLYPVLHLNLGISRVPLWLGISNIESYNLSGTAQGA